VLKEDAEHFGDGDDVLADRNFFENFLLDLLGKENDSLLMARRADVTLFSKLAHPEIHRVRSSETRLSAESRCIMAAWSSRRHGGRGGALRQ
jgi:hypothetical protein